MENTNENLNPVENAVDAEALFGRRPDGTPKVPFVPETAPIAEEVPAVEEPKHEDAPVQEVVSAPAYAAPEEQQLLAPVENGVIGATSAPKPVVEKKPKAEKVKEETVALRSTKNVTWSEVGKVYTGINIVGKSAADKWLTRSHISLATPEEVAKEFGK